VKRALVALLFVTGCHTPKWRAEQIRDEIAAVNMPNRDAALKSALDANHATLAEDLHAQVLMFRSDINGCVDADVVVEAMPERQPLVVSCNGLRNALLGGGAIDATSEDGKSSFVLIAVEALKGDHSAPFLLANGKDGGLLLVRLRLNVVRRRKIWFAGTCDFEPSPVHFDATTQMYVVPNRRASEVRAIDVPYDGHDTELVCDAHVE
jgi:hypothetical protein